MSFRRSLYAVLALALLVRVFVVLDTPHFVPQTDSADYDREAVSLAVSGSFPQSLLAPAGGPTAFRPPAFPLLLAGVYKLSGTGSATDRWRAGRLAEAVLGTATVALIYLIALELFGGALALLAGALAAIYPPLLLIGSSLMSESLFVPLLLGAVLCGLIARRTGRRRVPWALAAGGLIGIAALTRSVGIVAALPLLVLVWPGMPRFSRETLAAPLALVAAVVLVLIPWTVRNEAVLHAFVPVSTESGFALAGTYNAAARDRRDYPALWAPPVIQLGAAVRAHPRFNEAQLSSTLTSDAVSYAEVHPGYLAEVAFWSALRMLNLQGPGLERYGAKFEAYPPELAVISVYAFWIAGVLALLGLLARPWRLSPASFWAVPGAILLVTVFFSGGTRYRSPADPFLVMLAALGLRELTVRVRARSGLRRHRLPSAPR